MVGKIYIKPDDQHNLQGAFQRSRVGLVQQLLSSSRMEKTKKLFLNFLIFIVSVEVCLAQHWSYGLQPGGKRDAENVAESFQEIASEMEKIGKPQHFECTGSHPHSMFNGLKGALASLIEREVEQKKI